MVALYGSGGIGPFGTGQVLLLVSVRFALKTACVLWMKTAASGIGRRNSMLNSEAGVCSDHFEKKVPAALEHKTREL